MADNVPSLGILLLPEGAPQAIGIGALRICIYRAVHLARNI